MLSGAKLKKFEIWSAVGTIVFGSLLHFAFEWSGRIKAIALIAAVNESSWEHLKLAFWPAFIFSIIAYFAFARREQNFCLAQAKKLFVMPFLIVILFYGWLLFLKDNFIYDISIFVFAVIAGHIIAYNIETSKKNWGLKVPSLILISLLLISFSIFTFFPPKSFLFRDPTSGGYGIIN